eukprot:jgi/Galph1/3067/GphlegSOOS_G1750.1
MEPETTDGAICFETCVSEEQKLHKAAASCEPKEAIDLEEKRCHCGGLNESEVKLLQASKQRLDSSGRPAVSKVTRLFHSGWNFTAWLLEVAAICAISINKTLFRELVATLKLDCCVEVLRNGSWTCVDERTLVLLATEHFKKLPGDVICLRGGELVPGDILVLRSRDAILYSSTNGGPTIFSAESSSRIQHGSILLTGELTACISTFPDEDETWESTDGTKAAKNGVHPILEHLFFPIEIALLLFASCFAVVEIVIMFAVQHKTHERVVLDVLILLVSVSASSDVAFKDLKSIIELSKVQTIIFGQEGVLTCDSPPIVNSLVSSFAPYSTEEVLNAYQLVMFPSSSVTRESARNAVHVKDFCHRPGYHRVTVEDESNGVYTYYIGQVSVLLSLCPMEETQKTEIERIIQNFANQQYFALCVAVKKETCALKALRNISNDDIAVDTFISNRSDSNNSALSFMGIIPLNYCVREDTKAMVRQLRRMGISIKVAAYSQDFLCAKVCEELGIEYRDVALEDFPTPSNAILDIQSLEHQSPVTEDIQTPIRQEIVNFISGPTFERTAVVGCTFDHIILMSRGVVAISLPKAIAAVKALSHISFKETNGTEMASIIFNSQYIIGLLEDYMLAASTLATYFTIMSAVLTYGWGLEYSLFMAVIVMLCVVGSLLCMLVTETFFFQRNPERYLEKRRTVLFSRYEIAFRSIFLGLYGAISTIIFYLLVENTNFWCDNLPLKCLKVLLSFRGVNKSRH